MELVHDEKYSGGNEPYRFEIWEDEKGRTVKVFHITPNGDSLVETYPHLGLKKPIIAIVEKVRASISAYPQVKERKF